jgi:ATP-dependent Clp protease ATP-binding subunit ClpA
LSQDEFWSNEDYRENYKAILLSAAQRHFGPALFNRIDEKIGFNGLRQVDYTHIAKNALGDVIEHLHRATGVRLWYHADVPQALAAEVLTRSLAASARDMNRLVRKFVLDDAFAPLKLKEIDGARLAPAYQIQVVTRGRNRAFDRVDLVPASAPAESSAPR